MKGSLILASFLGLSGLFFVISSLTKDGLLPSGHGTGWLSELLIGIALIAYSGFKIWRATAVKGSTS